MAAERRRKSDQRSSAAIRTGGDALPVNVSRDTHGAVARRAYELYEHRGGEHGHDWDDWFQAEREINGVTSRAIQRSASGRKSASNSHRS
jgi:hypothetical protein